MLTFRLHEDDNVVVALNKIPSSTIIFEENISAVEDIPIMHKVAARDIACGKPIYKYRQIIGVASRDIKAGEHVHSHNCAIGEFQRDYAFCSGKQDSALVPMVERETFLGYKRSSGKVGTRNFIGVITTVNCSATAARLITKHFEREGALDDFPNVDGVVALTHGYGCGMSNSEADEGYGNLLRLMAGYAAHPNFAGVLMIGLGCEVMQVRKVMDYADLKLGDDFVPLTIQAAGGTRATIEAGIEAIEKMLPRANAAYRQPVPISELTIALQCGGSDALSGITANPALGRAVDFLVAQGGTAILSETPEIYGAEHLLTRRAITREVGEKLLARIQWWVDYTSATGGKMDNNPSPGNKAGGLTTILEKSLGAQAKGGNSNLNGVFKYAEPITSKGLVIMDSPGFDPASVTGQVASGATVICFTTGRGSAFGYKPAPSIKLATNTHLFENMSEDMDINCGTIIDGIDTLDSKGREILDTIIRIASGEKTKSEQLGYGDAEFTPWQIGAVM